MKLRSNPNLLALLALFGAAGFLPTAVADQPILTIRAQGALVIDDDGFAVARLRGTAPGMGKFTCYAEVLFVPGDPVGSLVGAGPAAFTAANGDIVTALVEWQIAADGTNDVLVHWRDDVTFSDGTTIASTGRFVDRRPPGPIYIKIGGDRKTSKTAD